MPVHPKRVLPTPPKSKLSRNLLVLILLGLAVYVFLPRIARIEHSFELLATLKIPLVALSLAAQILSYLGSGYLVRTVVKLAAKPVSVVDGALLTLGANSIGTLGGGIVGTAGMTFVWLRRRGVNPAAAGLAGWLPILLNNATLALVSVAGLAVLILRKKSSGVLVAGLSIAILLLSGGAGFLLWSLANRARLMRMAMGITGVLARIRRKAHDRAATEAAVTRLLEGWDELLQGGWRGPALGAILNTAFDISTLAFLFLAAGNGVSAAVLVAGYGLPQLLGKLTVILGGLGVVEAGMVGLYYALAVPRPIAVIVVLAYRLLSFWLPTLIGIAVATYFEHTTPNPDEAAA